jgi:transposase-like protein
VNHRNHLSAEQKAIILRELLDNKVPISELAEKYHVHVNLIHRWKKQLFEGAASLLTNKAGKKKKYPSSTELKKIALLEDKLKKRNEAISILLQENIEIKKSINGDD